MHIPVHSLWPPGYTDVMETSLIILTMAVLLPDRPHTFFYYRILIKSGSWESEGTPVHYTRAENCLPLFHPDHLPVYPSHQSITQQAACHQILILPDRAASQHLAITDIATSPG